MVNPFSDPLYFLTPLVGVIISFILAVFVVRKGLRVEANRLFGLTLLFVSLWALFVYLMRSSPDTKHALVWEQGALVFSLSIFVFYYHFTLVYTRAHNTKLLWAAYSYFILVAILGGTGLFVERMTWEGSYYAPQFTRLFSLLFIAGVFLMAMGIRNLLRAYHIASVYEDKVRYTYLVIAAILPFILAIPDFFPSLPPIGIFGNLLCGIISAVAIIKYHLLGINIVIRKSMAYLLVSTTIAAPYVAIIYIVYHVLGSDIPIWGHALIVAALAILLQSTWQKTRELVDRLFYGERYDYLKAIEDFGWQMNSIAESESLADSVVNIVSNALQARSACLLMPLHEKEGYRIVASYGVKDIPNQFILSKDSPLIHWMESNSGIVRKRDFTIMTQLQLIGDRVQNYISLLDGELFVPLVVRDQLVGILVLGRKLFEQQYSTEDERLLSSIAAQVAIELENAMLYARQREVNQQLLEQSDLKTEFLMAVAHELRTPLTAILSSSEVMSDTLKSSPSSFLRRLANNIHSSALSMNKRIEELLDSAKVRINTLEVNLEDTDLIPVVNSVVNILSVLFTEKKQSITLDIPSYLPMIIADRDRLEQILINLLSNANKFSPKDSVIEVRAFEADSMIVLEVEDSAEPITEKERSRLFEPYYRGEDPGRRQRLPGLGLGLVISKRLVEIQHGKMWVETTEGRGNIFAFSIPVAKEASEKVVVY
ncbi:ATP-binding protein [Chloroflexota bacterium]